MWQLLDELRSFTRRLSRQWSSVIPELTFVELMLLRTIATEEVATVQSVAGAMRVDKSTTSRQVAALEKRGFVEREAIPGERRAQAVRLTQLGERAMRDADQRNVDGIARRLADWPDKDVQKLASLLHAFNADDNEASD